MKILPEMWSGDSTHMRTSTAIAALMTVMLSACATVDVANMAGAENFAIVDAIPEDNVVIRASEELTAEFASQAWVKPQEQSVTKAANMLLKGRSKSAKLVKASYSDQATQASEVRQDIAQATELVDQTFKAADVYLSMADHTAELRDELKALEQALILSRRAEYNFRNALQSVSIGTVDNDMAGLNGSISSLRKVTDIYGARVRAKAVSKTIPAS